MFLTQNVWGGGGGGGAGGEGEFDFKKKKNVVPNSENPKQWLSISISLRNLCFSLASIKDKGLFIC